MRQVAGVGHVALGPSSIQEPTPKSAATGGIPAMAKALHAHSAGKRAPRHADP